MQQRMDKMRLLSKEEIKEEDQMIADLRLERYIEKEEKIIGEECDLIERSKGNGGTKKSLRDKIIDFIKSQGCSHKEENGEFEDETTDLFAQNGTLIEVVITTGIDNEVVDHMMTSHTV